MLVVAVISFCFKFAISLITNELLPSSLLIYFKDLEGPF